ncbi:MAG: hypothetical protein ACI4F0_09555 [Agathobacter sp.]
MRTIFDFENHGNEACMRLQLWKVCGKCWNNNDGGKWCKEECRRDDKEKEGGNA